MQQSVIRQLSKSMCFDVYVRYYSAVNNGLARAWRCDNRLVFACWGTLKCVNNDYCNGKHMKLAYRIIHCQHLPVHCGYADVLSPIRTHSSSKRSVSETYEIIGNAKHRFKSLVIPAEGCTTNSSCSAQLATTRLFAKRNHYTLVPSENKQCIRACFLEADGSTSNIMPA